LDLTDPRASLVNDTPKSKIGGNPLDIIIIGFPGQVVGG